MPNNSQAQQIDLSSLVASLNGLIQTLGSNTTLLANAIEALTVRSDERYAKLNGNAAETFMVADATIPTEAVALSQVTGTAPVGNNYGGVVGTSFSWTSSKILAPSNGFVFFMFDQIQAESVSNMVYPSTMNVYFYNYSYGGILSTNYSPTGAYSRGYAGVVTGDEFYATVTQTYATATQPYCGIALMFIPLP